MIRVTLLRALLAVVAVLAVAGCSSLEGAGDKGYVSGDGSVRVLDVAERGEPITLSGEDLDGRPLDLADFRGRPTVVNVWGAWCAECNEEAPDLVAADKQLGDSAHFVGINIRDGSQAQAQGYVRTFGLEFPSFWAPDGKALLEFQGTLTPNAVPATVVLDADGRVAATILGVLPSTQTLVDVVKEVGGDSAPDGQVADG